MPNTSKDEALETPKTDRGFILFLGFIAFFIIGGAIAGAVVAAYLVNSIPLGTTILMVSAQQSLLDTATWLGLIGGGVGGALVFVGIVALFIGGCFLIGAINSALRKIFPSFKKDETKQDSSFTKRPTLVEQGKPVKSELFSPTSDKLSNAVTSTIQTSENSTDKKSEGNVQKP